MVITSVHDCLNKTCADIAYCSAPYGANAMYTARKRVHVMPSGNSAALRNYRTVNKF